MELSRKTDFAIRIMRHLLSQNGTPQSPPEIATAIDVDYPYVKTICNQLHRAGFLAYAPDAVKFILTKPADEINLYDLIAAIEGEICINECLKEGHICEHGDAVECGVRPFLSNIQDALVKTLREQTLIGLVPADNSTDS